VASVNTTSIREEITHVKQQLDEQVRSGKVADETRMLISTLLMIVDMLVAIFLEKSTKKGNKNSSIPSSQTDEDNSSKPERRTRIDIVFEKRIEHTDAQDQDMPILRVCEQGGFCSRSGRT